MKRMAGIVFVWIFFCAGIASAQTHEEMVETYMALSGVDDALMSFPAQLQASMSQRILVSKHPEMDKQVMQIMTDAYDLEAARDNMRGYLLEYTDMDFLQQLLQWLHTPLSRKIISEEKKSSDPDNQAAMVQYINDLRTFPPSSERIALINEVVKVTEVVELTTNVVIKIMGGMINSLNMVLPQGKQESKEQIDAKIEMTRAGIKEALRQQMTLTSYYTYRNISDDELMTYIEFYRSKIGKREIKTTGDALSYVLEAWFGQAGAKLAGIMKDVAEKKRRELDVKDHLPKARAL